MFHVRTGAILQTIKTYVNIHEEWINEIYSMAHDILYNSHVNNKYYRAKTGNVLKVSPEMNLQINWTVRLPIQAVPSANQNENMMIIIPFSMATSILGTLGQYYGM